MPLYPMLDIIEKKIRTVGEKIKPRSPAIDLFEYCLAYLNEGEVEMAYVCMRDNIIEDEIKISMSEYRELVAIAEYFGNGRIEPYFKELTDPGLDNMQ